MRLLKWFIIGTVVLVALLYAVGPFLPNKALVERSILIEAPVSVIEECVTDLEIWEKWEPWGPKDDSMTVQYGEIRRGLGASHTWSGKIVGQGERTLTAINPGVRIDFTLVFDGDTGVPAFTAFHFDVVSAEETRVTWTFEGELGSNPISRIIGLFLDDILGRFYEDGLTSLKNEAIERANELVHPPALIPQ
jgi:hypothetical protein|tara:strand:- start:454 stop:1029 length:576 start_codon:yes stop_codon:yes gene_type:complete